MRWRRIQRYDEHSKLINRTPTRLEQSALEAGRKAFRYSLIVPMIAYSVAVSVYLISVSSENRPGLVDIAAQLAQRTFDRTPGPEDSQFYLGIGYFVHAVVFALATGVVLMLCLWPYYKIREAAPVRIAGQVYRLLTMLHNVERASIEMSLGAEGIPRYSEALADARKILQREAIAMSRSYAQMAGLRRRDGLSEQWTRLPRLLAWSLDKPSSRITTGLEGCVQALMRIYTRERPAEPLDIEIADIRGRSLRPWSATISRFPRDFGLPASIGLAIALGTAAIKLLLSV